MSRFRPARWLATAVLLVCLGASSSSAATAERRAASVEPPDPLADGGLHLRSSDQLTATAGASDRRREILLLEWRTLQMRNDRHHDQQALSDKIGWLEADVAELKRAAERLQLEASALAPLPAKGAPVVVAAGDVTASGAAPGSAVDAALPGGSPAKTGTRAAVAAATVDPGEWATYAGLLAAALLLSLLLFRHRAPKRDPLPSVLPVTPSGFGDRSPLPRATDPRGNEDVATVPPVMTADPDGSGPPSVQPARAAALRVVVEPETSAAETAIDLAEIMLTFGRVGGAAKTLQEYLAANPKEAVRPWIRLLQIYQDNGMREEFEAMAQKLNRNFNVEIIRWQAAAGEAATGDVAATVLPLPADEPPALTLEDLPHIRDRIVFFWGGAECLPYLEQLLRDNRDGQRTGFTLPVVEELLFLIELTTARDRAD